MPVLSQLSDPGRLRMDAVSGSLLEDLLLFACEGLQLTPTLHGKAVEHYEAVSKLLAEPHNFFSKYDAEIYPQGSFLIGTTTRAILQCEYDLDFVVQLAAHAPRDPMLLLDQLEKLLKGHGTYKDMVKRLKRCVRLIYAGGFHMDILPALSEQASGTRILVPDRKLVGWKPSNPRGFAAWFKRRGVFVRMDKAASIEPVPAMQSVDEKTSLQRVVQLLKRARDRFVTDLDLSPRSIVLTTLAAEGYNGATSTAGTMSQVLQSMRDRVATTSGAIEVYNPANDDELLSEQWRDNPAAYREFKRWLGWFSNEWSMVMSAQRLPELQKLLGTLFGDEVAVDAIKKHAARTDELRKAEKLKIQASGAIAGASLPAAAVIRSNTFYGDE